MPIALKQKNGDIKVKEYITDQKGHKIAAIIDIVELNRLKKMLKTIPPSEVWLYKNEGALGYVREGLRDASRGKVSKLNLDEL